MSSPICLILGAGANIGANVAKAFAGAGYKCVLTARNQPAEANASYAYVQGDLSKHGGVESIFSEVRKAYGEPSVVVYNGSYPKAYGLTSSICRDQVERLTRDSCRRFFP